MHNFILTQTDNGHLSLIDQSSEFKPFSIDFIAPKILQRIQTIGRKDPLARAIGIKQHLDKPQVIDATAGCGSDSMLMAALGCHVTLIEQSETVHALLKDALERAQSHTKLKPIIEHITLLHGDACILIPTLPKADVIYLDPMFPESKSHAKVKKNMQILQHIVGHQSEESLLTIAKRHTHRVVLKRPQKIDIKPPKEAQVIETKTTQFWVFNQ